MNDSLASLQDNRSRPRRRLWLLALVPSVPAGRWLSGCVIFGLALLVFQLGGALSVHPNGGQTWSVALFFCVILAYITPVFHYVTERTEEAFDELAEHLPLQDAERQAVRAEISSKTGRWYLSNSAIAVLVWLLQSWLLAGDAAHMGESISRSSLGFVMSIGPLFVWLFMFCGLNALVDNARLFRRLTRELDVDLLDPQALNPVGRMAVSSTLLVIGSQASFPIMWIGGSTDPWTTIPGIIGTTIALVFMFLVPVWPVHLALRAAKRRALASIQREINEHRGVARTLDATTLGTLQPLLIYRREIDSVPEWPFDLGIVTRLGLYLVIVPLTWIGAALIEILVDVFLAG